MKTSPGAVDSRRVAINFMLLSAGEFLAKILTFLAFSHLARTLGPERYGSLEFVLAATVFFALATDFGLGTYGAREIAKTAGSASDADHAASGLILREIIVLRLLMGLASLVALFVFLRFIYRTPEQEMLLAVYGFSLLGGPALLQWFFQAHDRMHWVAITSILRQGIFAGFLILFFRPGTPLIYIGFAELVSVAVVGLVCLAVARNEMNQPLTGPPLKLTRLLSRLRDASPIGFTELAWAFQWYFATVVLGLLFADQSLGWFGASHRALMALHTFVWLYFFNLLPSISRCVAKPDHHLLTLMDRSMRLTAWSGIFIAFMLTTLGKALLVLAFGDQFAAAADSFCVLVWILPVAMLSGHHRFTLIAYNQQSKLLVCTVASAVMAIALGLVLVPLFGSTGAAWAMLAAQVGNLVLAYIYVRRHVVEIPVLVHLGKPLAALSVAIGTFLTVEPSNFWVAAAVASFVYGGALAVSQGSEALSLMRLLRQRRAAPDLSAGAPIEGS